ncbi:hypothetical protein Mapa_010516 [Marchantia paleacea]|nr:hypothetical protein Mapa_010516 [Marchantia paleacea]
MDFLWQEQLNKLLDGILFTSLALFLLESFTLFLTIHRLNCFFERFSSILRFPNRVKSLIDSCKADHRNQKNYTMEKIIRPGQTQGGNTPWPSKRCPIPSFRIEIFTMKWLLLVLSSPCISSSGPPMRFFSLISSSSKRSPKSGPSFSVINRSFLLITQYLVRLRHLLELLASTMLTLTR